MSNQPDSLTGNTPEYTELEKKVRAIGEYLGCNEDELWSEMLNLITLHTKEAVEEVAKAYGGCTLCYGKGYSTGTGGLIGYDDFGGEGFKTPIKTVIKYCTCGRGKQLSQLTNPTERKA